jgi:hypothetical protein
MSKKPYSVLNIPRQHAHNMLPTLTPHPYTKPRYGATTQYTAPPDLSEPLDKAGITRLQETIGVLLYYARAINSTMLVALGTLASAQASGTKTTAKATTHLLNYAATHPEAVLRNRASDMLLRIRSDVSYLSELHARSLPHRRIVLPRQKHQARASRSI